MKKRKHMVLPIAVMLMLTAIGCDENENARLAQMAVDNLQRQAEQNRQMVELQHEITDGARQLVEADAEARQEIIAAQQQLQGEQARIGQQRDVLEQERKVIAQQRHRDPIIAKAITQAGLLMACLLPLVLCWFLLKQPAGPVDDAQVAEVLLTDLTSHDPLFLIPRETKTKLSDTRRATFPDLEGDSDDTRLASRHRD